ncbi:hypothetical protein SAMN05444161_4659 [Rhizobiales bacterium GAS191]|nr:hypothetical protein SAMN05444161_4659 [Rhizobiales bacterium GAS191]
MAGKFTIENRTPKGLKVLHVASGLRYTFRVSKLKSGQRVLKGDYSPGSPSARPFRERLEPNARTFAEREARKADLID